MFSFDSWKLVKTVTKFRKVLSSLADKEYDHHKHINTLVKSLTLLVMYNFCKRGDKNILRLCFVKSIIFHRLSYETVTDRADL